MTRYTRRAALRLGASAAFAATANIFTPSKVRAARKEKIVYWHLPNFTPLADELQRQQVFEFAKQAGLKDDEVQFSVISNEEFTAKIAAGLETGNPPDVARFYESFIQLYRSQGHLLDVTDVVKAMQAEPGGLFQSSLTAVRYQNRYWGAPLAVNPWPMHSRIDLLEKAKLDFPDTWDGFVEVCKKIQRPPFYGFGMCLGAQADGTDNIMQVCFGFGGKTVDEDERVVFNSPGNVAGFRFIADMYNKHKIIPKGAVSWDNSGNNKAYQSKQVAFVNNPASIYAYLAGSDPDLQKRTGLFGVPAGPAGKVNLIDTWSYGIFAKAPYPDLVKGLLQHLMKPAHYNKIITATDGRWVPVYPKLFDDPWWTARKEFEKFREIAHTGVPISHAGPPSAASGEILSTHVIPRAMQRVLVDGVAAEQAVADVHKQIEEIYQRRKG